MLATLSAAGFVAVAIILAATLLQPMLPEQEHEPPEAAGAAIDPRDLAYQEVG